MLIRGNSDFETGSLGITSRLREASHSFDKQVNRHSGFTDKPSPDNTLRLLSGQIPRCEKVNLLHEIFEWSSSFWIMLSLTGGNVSSSDSTNAWLNEDN